MKWYYFVIAAVVVVLLGAGIYVGINYEKWSCEAQGGEWDYIGLSISKMCNLPTSDGGTECNSMEECEGDCIADLSAEEMELVWNGTTVYATGICTHWQLSTGCFPFVVDGKVEVVTCMD